MARSSRPQCSSLLPGLRNLRRCPLALIRRLPTYEAQIAALLAQQHKRLYKQEGQGKLYVTTHIADADVRAYRGGLLTLDGLMNKLEFKIGHTKHLARRQRQYLKCDDGQTHLWLWSYSADRRYLAERLIHLQLQRRHAKALVIACPGCNVHHREFYCLACIGGLRGLDGVVRKVVGSLGQTACRRTKIQGACPLTRYLGRSYGLILTYF
ncbi:hypothetical protein B0H13DRAFT_805032 [Mycena leptocephala]|nr:hypothetical protein B0H13DRAFT_805032 [Mycena leptocephala]